MSTAASLASDPYRLPTHVRPTRYDVRLRPSLDDATFSGEVTIAIDLDEPTESITLNAIELGIEAVTLDGAAATWALDEATERLTVEAPSTLDSKTATLHIEFTGILNDKLRGFYRSTYIDDQGEEQVVATTQMQATDCRRAFPCWDEPEFKAVFAITLDIADGLTAISNGPEVERTSQNGRTVVRFADTMIMSAYLVAFVVGRVEVTESVDVNGTPLRVVHVPGREHLTQFALDVGSFCLQWFEEYYEIDYPSDKIDLVGLPDFAAGAMENLGCITFREDALLVDPASSTQNERQRVADVVAHELAHMWFGDLVTMRWWNGIWLNEAFATFMEIAACDAFAPDWKRWTSFGQERSAAFEVDSLASTRPVEFEVKSPAEADGMFDVLTYQKGGALLRMLEQYIGPEVFRVGVNAYLRKHSYANTETNDLWDAIESSSGQPVRAMMDSWIWQPGFPLITATLVSDAGEPHLELRQQRFGYGADDDANPVWVVPVHVRNGGDTQLVVLDSDQPVLVPLSAPDEVVVVNAGGHGFFRVAYDGVLRERIAQRSSLATMDTLERYMLVDDALAATVAGQMSATGLLDVLDGFTDENEFGVWQAIVIALGGVSRLVDGDALEALRARIRSLVAPALGRLGGPVSGETDLTAKLRGQLTRTMGAIGQDSDTIERCTALFNEATAGGVVDRELLAAATVVVSTSGGVAEYEMMLAGFENAATPQDQMRHLYALCDFDDAELVARTCELAMSGRVKSQNAPFLLRGAMAHRNHSSYVWNFIKEHWEQANDTFPNNTIAYMIDSVKLMSTPEAVDDAAAFFAANPIEQASSTLEQILERQRVNTAWRTRDANALTAALTGR
ncbi:MAG: M1 family metallopeptidase [Ilumatobacter sp.]